MSKQIQRRRGSSANHQNFTGAAGELTVDTTNNRIVVHDGVLGGGHTGVKRSDVFSTNGYPNLTDPAGVTRFQSNSSQTSLTYVGGTAALLAETNAFYINTPSEVDIFSFDGDNFTLKSPDSQTSLRVISGGAYVGPGTSLTSNAKGGFLHIPTITGQPTRTNAPNILLGYAPIVLASGQSRLYLYNPSGAWNYVALQSL